MRTLRFAFHGVRCQELCGMQKWAVNIVQLVCQVNVSDLATS